jgi:hypothetical protein
MCLSNSTCATTARSGEAPPEGPDPNRRGLHLGRSVYSSPQPILPPRGAARAGPEGGGRRRALPDAGVIFV